MCLKIKLESVLSKNNFKKDEEIQDFWIHSIMPFQVDLQHFENNKADIIIGFTMTNGKTSIAFNGFVDSPEFLQKLLYAVMDQE